jgi:alkanesulfonate monooxygenase SsuD/methylene tetrahydromethanopterin reductase-like flavin-dependent oxidoreductase (luciferase family)
MKLYIWVNPYRVSYGSSLVFAVAESEEAARLAARTGDAYTFWKYPAPMPGATLGVPDRVVDLPAAEWHEWRE